MKVIPVLFVVWRLPSVVLTLVPVGIVVVPESHRNTQFSVKVTSPTDGWAGIDFEPVAVPGRLCNSLALTAWVTKWSGDPAAVPGAPSNVTSALIAVPDTDRVAVALGRYRMPTSRARIASAPAPIR